MQNKNLNRRHFIKTTAAVAGAYALPQFAIASTVRANSKLNIACIGVGGRGNAHISACLSENIVALCDADFDYAAKNAATAPANAKRFTDYRVMLDKMGNEIDAVTIATPDHNHFPIAMACMAMGKHVVIEKPLTHTVWEARTLQKAAKRYRVITQMGNQGHATDHIRMGKEWVQAGCIGNVTEVHAWNGGPGQRYFGTRNTFPPPTAPIPKSLNWDLWLGPRSKRAYSPDYGPLTWRGWWDFGSGSLGDWGCHTVDMPFWALDLDAPVSVQAQVGPSRAAAFIPDWSIVTWEFAARGTMPPVTVTWYDGGKKPKPPIGMKEVKKGGMYMVGSKATLMTGSRPNHGPYLTELDKLAELKKNRPAESIARVEGGHWQEFFRAIKGTGPTPGSNFDYAVPLTQMLLIGSVVQRFPGETLHWDNNVGQFKNHENANALLRFTPREGWEEPDWV
jgi:predicted dehydrogenase